jgi:hypothetical protein
MEEARAPFDTHTSWIERDIALERVQARRSQPVDSKQPSRDDDAEMFNGCLSIEKLSTTPTGTTKNFHVVQSPSHTTRTLPSLLLAGITLK